MLKRLLLVTAIVALATLASAPGVVAPANAATSVVDTEDVLVMTNGRRIHGQILEETDSEVVIEVRIGNMPPVKTSYPKRDIVDIRYDVEIEGDADASEEADAGDGEARSGKTEQGKDVNDETTLFYVAELDGLVGFDLSITPLRDIFEDVDRTFDDLVPSGGGDIEKVVDPRFRDKHVVLFKVDAEGNPRAGFDGIFAVNNLEPIIKEQRLKGRRIIYWVENALGGACFLPFTSPEIYFRSDGRMGGVGNLDDFDIGDELVNKKQISLRMGHAEGYVIDGGYGEIGVQIINAMVRRHNWFFARTVGGKPEVLLRPLRGDDGGGWTMLSDNGEGEFEDDEDSLYGNDVLNLEADWAHKLGVSKDTVDTMGDLTLAMGGNSVYRNYKVIEDNRAERILDRWSEELREAVEQINPEDGYLWQEFNRIEVNGDYEQRSQRRGQKIRLLKRIRGIITRFEEVLDPDGSWRADIDVQLEIWKQEADRDRREQRRQRDNGGGGGGGGGGGRPGGIG